MARKKRRSPGRVGRASEHRAEQDRDHEAREDERYDVFVSYARTDSEKVRHCLEYLEDRAVKYDWDRNFRPGGPFPSQIVHAIHNASCFMVFLSRAALGSDWVRREIQIASERGKPILAIELETLPNGLSPKLEEIVGHLDRPSVFDSAFLDKLDRWLRENNLGDAVVTKNSAEEFVKEARKAIENGKGALASKYLQSAEDLANANGCAKCDVAVTELRLKLCEASQNGPGMRSALWRMREMALRRGSPQRRRIARIDRQVLDSIFGVDSKDWAESADGYDRFIRDYPGSLGVRLIEFIVAQLLALHAGRRVERVIDLCCGTGVLARTLSHLRANITAIGYDVPAMITIAEDAAAAFAFSGDPRSPSHEFWPISKLVQHACAARPRLADAAVMNMAIFQFGLRERSVLLNLLNRCLLSGAPFLIGTHGPDFAFPYTTLNEENPFKAELHHAWLKMGFEPPRTPAESVQPRYSKDTLHSLRCLLEICGFGLLTDEGHLPVLSVERTIQERIGFTRLPVISRKVYGTTIEDRWWDSALAELKKERSRGGMLAQDILSGTVLLARKTHSAVPFMFFESPAPPQKKETIVFAAAAVVRNRKGETLTVRRGPLGPHVRDFPNTWSLPSTSARNGTPMGKQLEVSLKRHIGIDVDKMTPLATRIALRAAGHEEKVLFVMTLYLAECRANQCTPKLKTRKYIDLVWRNDRQIMRLRSQRERVGDCIVCYEDTLRSGWKG